MSSLARRAWIGRFAQRRTGYSSDIRWPVGSCGILLELQECSSDKSRLDITPSGGRSCAVSGGDHGSASPFRGKEAVLGCGQERNPGSRPYVSGFSIGLCRPVSDLPGLFRIDWAAERVRRDMFNWTRLKIVTSMLVLFGSGLRAADPSRLSGGPSLSEILARMTKMDEDRQSSLRRYSSVRRYTLENKRFGTFAEIRARMSYELPGTNRFEVLSEHGSGVIRKSVGSRDKVSGSVYLAMLVVFALMPRIRVSADK
jgi:hypothetical protein